MGKLKDTVSEFLTEAGKSSAAAVTLCQQDSVVKALFQTLEDASLYAIFLESICELLFRFCRSELEELQRFSSYFIPTALALYLRLNRHPAARAIDLSHLEVYLLAAYNIETCDTEGKEIVHSFTVPALHKPSIYHESMMPPASAALTENALSRLEQGLHDARVVIGPFQEAVRISRDNVHRISALLMRVYNANISYMPGASREATLRGAQKVISQRCPRIELSSEYLLEVLHCAYFSMFNGQYVLGNETVSLIRTRARQSLLAEVCLVANAMRQSLLDSKDSAKSTQQPMGIRVTVNSSFKNLTKNVLTNASFRTRKLSDESAGERASIVIHTEGYCS
ncbi:protein FAM126B-like isoform X2 [Varroa jacobsoni]|uniref:Hyccin n=1 Tax=Varroa destructor TaxID=109461 RepID=A0A7M7JST1_VARDE|nr:protein FAM126B-like isoform X2 [Varroa destructor]XP_022697240.1 protein FAM126B-like isoform X2 [Varroa jacobsoni]